MVFIFQKDDCRYERFNTMSVLGHMDRCGRNGGYPETAQMVMWGFNVNKIMSFSSFK